MGKRVNGEYLNCSGSYTSFDLAQFELLGQRLAAINANHEYRIQPDIDLQNAFHFLIPTFVG
jgi:hypothetical protein